MKNVKNISLLLCSLIILSCSTEDKTIDEVLASVSSGGVLRTIDIDNNMTYNDIEQNFVDGANYILTLEQQDNQQGGLLQEVEVYARFVENTLDDTNNDGNIDDDDEDISTEEELFETIDASEFSTGERGVPVTTITYTAEELLAFTGVDESKIEGTDEFALRLVLKLSDGRSFSIDDANGNVSGGSYFSSPFQYRTPISCAITEDLSGIYTYNITSLTSAPGGRSNCPAAPLTGEVTWESTSTEGEYTTSDISFGQFDACYTDTFSDIEFEGILVAWDCTNLVAEGTIETVEENTGTEIDFTYIYEIISASGSDIEIQFSNSAGDRGTVVLTRPDNKIWPNLLSSN